MIKTRPDYPHNIFQEINDNPKVETVQKYTTNFAFVSLTRFVFNPPKWILGSHVPEYTVHEIDSRQVSLLDRNMLVSVSTLAEEYYQNCDTSTKEFKDGVAKRFVGILEGLYPEEAELLSDIISGRFKERYPKITKELLQKAAQNLVK